MKELDPSRPAIKKKEHLTKNIPWLHNLHNRQVESPESEGIPINRRVDVSI
jgi:hypothetical protein